MNPAFMPCCGIYSIAVVVDKPFNDVFNTAKVILNKRNQWRGRTNSYHRRLIMEHYGVRFKWVPVSPMTVKRWVTQYTERDKTYIVEVNGHVFTVKNNVITDQYHCENVHHSEQKQKRVKKVWVVIN